MVHGLEHPAALPRAARSIPSLGGGASLWLWSACRDAAGRDFSVNSLMMDPHTGDVFDCNGGLRHLRAWLLAPASMATSSLTADPVRCLRCGPPTPAPCAYILLPESARQRLTKKACCNIHCVNQCEAV